MFERDLLDEEIKKKKRRVLVVLLVLLLGIGMLLPMVDLTASPAAVSEAVTETPARTITPTDSPALSTRGPMETITPTATSTHIPVAPTATEGLLSGGGGGEPDASPAPTGVPEPVSPTPKEPELLPVAGASAGESGRLALGLAAVLLGVLLMMAGLALYTRH